MKSPGLQMVSLYFLFPDLLLGAYTALFMDKLHLYSQLVPSRCPTVLASPASWGLHGHSLTASHDDF